MSENTEIDAPVLNEEAGIAAAAAAESAEILNLLGSDSDQAGGCGCGGCGCGAQE